MPDMFDFSGMEAEISRLIDSLNRAVTDVENGTEEAALQAAEIIRDEQQRLFSKADFKRDKRSHQYNRANESLIKIKRDDRARGKVYKLRIGYDTETLRRYPELLVIEFGRPGKSRNRRSKKDKLGRKKGDFPAHISHIRAGFFLAKEKAVNTFNERLMEIVRNDFRD